MSFTTCLFLIFTHQAPFSSFSSTQVRHQIKHGMLVLQVSPSPNLGTCPDRYDDGSALLPQDESWRCPCPRAPEALGPALFPCLNAAPCGAWGGRGGAWGGSAAFDHQRLHWKEVETRWTWQQHVLPEARLSVAAVVRGSRQVGSSQA